MCIRYNIDFWLPISNDQPDWERRVKRGLAQPGWNTGALVVHFYECRGKLLKQAACAPYEIRQGGCYRGRILDFCYQDEHCFLRMMEMQSACTAAKREAERMEGAREHPEIQTEVTNQWRKAYDDWLSAYEHHRGCPDRRYMSPLFQELKRAGIVFDKTYIDDATRMGAHPSTEAEPIIGITRQYDAPPRRR